MTTVHQVLLPDLFRQVANDHAEQVAVDIPPASNRPARQTLTYGELEQRADGVASLLSSLITREMIVPVILGRDSIHLLPAQIGLNFAGLAHACFDPKLPDERLKFMMADTASLVILTDKVNQARVRRLASPSAKIFILDDIEPSEARTTLPTWFGPETLAYVIYTSGTTGRPKGVMIEHRGVAGLILSDIERFCLQPGDRAAQGSSPSYDSSVEEIWLALSVGATVVVLDEETTRLGPDLIPWLRDEKIAVFCPPPTLLRAIGCRNPGDVLPDLRLLYVGGEALDADLAAIWGEPFWLENGYGPTETTVTALRCRVPPEGPVLIGEPVPGMEAFVLSADGQLLPDGEFGELCLRGVGLARGYLNLPEETARRFEKHGSLGRIYHTGDLVRKEACGGYSYHGRIDSQVKIRGHRIELEEIESRLIRIDGIREAACHVQGSKGREFVAAWLVVNDNESLPDHDDIVEQLRAGLPEHMVPSRFGFLDELPRSVGGKLARKLLKDVELDADAHAGKPETRAATDLESLVEAAICDALERPGPLDVEANFFDVLEGDSLRAAMVIGILRDDERAMGVTVKDLYDAPTIRSLARVIDDHQQQTAPPGDRRSVSKRPQQKSPYGAAAIQGLWFAISLIALGAALWFGFFKVVPYLLDNFSITALLVVLPLLVLGVRLVTLPITVILAALAKRLLIGRYHAGRHPVYGAFYIRHWIVTRLVRFIPWGLIAGTVFQNRALSMLGARIGKRVHIHRGVNFLDGGWDLLQVGDDVTVGQDASLRCADLENGEIVFQSITVEDGATIATRAGLNGGSHMQAYSRLEPLSVLKEWQVIPEGECWDGVPASFVRPAPVQPSHQSDEWNPVSHGVMAILLGAFFDFLFAIPGITVILACFSSLQVANDEVVSWIEAPVALPLLILGVLAAVLIGGPLGLILQALFLRVLGPMEERAVSRWSWDFLIYWIKTGTVATANNRLSGTMFWPRWLRLAGMRIGYNSEVSTIIDVVPEHIEIGEQSFFADGIYLGGPDIDRGVLTMKRTKVGSRTFFGNHVVVDAGEDLPDDVLLGICTRSHQNISQGSSWFGIPAFRLPRREVVDMPRELTHEPSAFLYIQRLFFESMRFALPLLPLGLTLFWIMIASSFARDGVGWQTFLFDLPALNITVGAALLGAVLFLKWLFLGKTKPGQHGFWSGWCCRWDYLYVAWGAWARPILTNFEGTPYLHWYLRAMGVRIGRNVILGSGFAQVVDPDMIDIDDNATVNGLFQAHSFEDRVLKMEKVRIGPSATTHDNSVLMYGAHIGSQTTVAHHSVVMKRERLLPNHHYEGAPTKLV